MVKKAKPKSKNKKNRKTAGNKKQSKSRKAKAGGKTTRGKKQSKKQTKAAKRVKKAKAVKTAQKKVSRKSKTKSVKPKARTSKETRPRKSRQKETAQKKVAKKATKITRGASRKAKQKKRTTKSKKKQEKGGKKGTKKQKKKLPFEDEEIKIIKLQPPEEEEEAREKKIVLEFDEEEEAEPKVNASASGAMTVQLKKKEEAEKPSQPEVEERRPGPRMRCPECGSTNLRWDYERAELVCMDCGAVIEENIIDLGPEWRAFDAYQKTRRQRTGSPIKYTRPNKGLVTEIDKYNKDIRGSKLSPEVASQMGRIRKWHKRSGIASSIERNLTIAMGDLERISSYLGLPQNIREAAAILYRKAVEKGLIRGRLIESVVAAVIYMICRQYGIPRTLDEISEVSGLSKKEIGRTYRFLKKELYVDVPLTNPIHYVSRFASALGLSGKVQEKAKEILNEAIEKGLISGRGPTGVAAAAVYIASVMLGERRTQKEVAEVAGVTEVTIRNRYRELKRELNIDIEDEE